MNAKLLRDESGEPVRRLTERDRYGRFITPRYDFIWLDDPELVTEQERTAS